MASLFCVACHLNLLFGDHSAEGQSVLRLHFDCRTSSFLRFPPLLGCFLEENMPFIPGQHPAQSRVSAQHSLIPQTRRLCRPTTIQLQSRHEKRACTTSISTLQNDSAEGTLRLGSSRMMATTGWKKLLSHRCRPLRPFGQ